MSQLYIRLRTGFFTHRKTIRLCTVIGDDAYWVVPRLWAYAAEHQPDGDFSSYSSEELAMLLGCIKHASSILQALKDSGFIENDGKIHDWEEHNGYHEKFSERAKIAATARWSKEKPPTPPKEEGQGKGKGESGDKHCSTHATSIPQASGDEEWRKSLALNPTYAGIDVEREFGKAVVWCGQNNRKCTRKFFINWMNRADKPMAKCQPAAPISESDRIKDLARRGVIAW